MTSQGAFWPLLQGGTQLPLQAHCINTKATLPFLRCFHQSCFWQQYYPFSYLVAVKYGCQLLGCHDSFVFEKGKPQGIRLDHVNSHLISQLGGKQESLGHSLPIWDFNLALSVGQVEAETEHSEGL